ncbi:MAG: tRNA-intron lyase [Candidatus Bathyarchaeales archaeon]
MTLEQTEKKSRSLEGDEQKKIEAVLSKKEITVSTSNDVDALSSRGYGTVENGKLKLAFFEALFLLEKKLIDVKQKKPKKTLSFHEVLQRFKKLDTNAWAKYLIYRDLRSRGYVAREGFGIGIDFRLYERGEYGKDTAKYVVFGIQEGKPVSIEELTRVLKYAQGSKKTLILAVLNRRGEVVYYTLSQLTIR